MRPIQEMTYIYGLIDPLRNFSPEERAEKHRLAAESRKRNAALRKVENKNNK